MQSNHESLQNLATIVLTRPSLLRLVVHEDVKASNNHYDDLIDLSIRAFYKKSEAGHMLMEASNQYQTCVQNMRNYTEKFEQMERFMWSQQLTIIDLQHELKELQTQLNQALDI